ncbi:hypothetical protein MUN89_16275 [Halobacillus salinarum]|uniref:Uncharacterized protein n=1 Tax=Halobacillus salinarum TaxID=2932257 RepID=A0ABY4EHI4_9BACI|nr:hypothetical protein [Halobacillus salinarum]UOQ43460.1 hypothetical protein MUN89_16275 [Halobacillus salinarum]
MMVLKGIWAGTASGITLGLFLLAVESVTKIKVYTLLMNVDFVPWLGSINWPWFMEWFFHLLISWGIGFLFVYVITTRHIDVRSSKWLTASILAGLAAFSYVPLTLLASKETPSLSNLSAVFYWLAGHVLYALVLNISFKK